MRSALQVLAAVAAGGVLLPRRLATAAQQRCSLTPGRGQRIVPLAAGHVCGWRPRPRQRKSQRLQAWCRVLHPKNRSMRVLEWKTEAYEMDAEL